MEDTMGYSKTPAYRIEIIDQSGYKWQAAFDLKATQANLAAWISKFNYSVTEGINKHLGEGAKVSEAYLVSQKGVKRGQVVAQIKL